MDTPETPAAADIDLGGAPASEDPFAEENLPPDPLAGGELPPGVEQGSLGGDNPSEEAPEPIVPDEERDASQDEDEEPVAEVEGPESPTSPPAEEPEPIAAQVDEPEAVPGDEPQTPVAASGDGESSAVGEPEPPKPPSKRKSRKKTAKTNGKSGVRGYVILRPGAEPGEWVEAFERPEEGQPFLLEARNSESAKRKAYRMLAEGEDGDGPQEYVLNPVPAKLWNPTVVSGRVHKQIAITVGG